MDSVAEIGFPAPEFALDDLAGVTHRLKDMRGRVVVLNFWSAECPWSARGDERIHDLEVPWQWGREAVLWRVASNANEPVAALRRASAARNAAPVLHDPAQQVADLYGAVTTPHIFIIGEDGILRYKGALNDASWRDPEPDHSYLLAGVKAALEGRSPAPAETPGRGCTVVRYEVMEE
jgi:peroxiredoxin